MIAGIGIDLVRIPRMRELIERFGERFLRRVFLDPEKDACLARPDSAQEFAACFAAKEAVMKALGAGMGQGVRFLDIQLVSPPGKQPSVLLHRGAERIAKDLGVEKILISLTHEGEYAAAQAVAVQRT